MELGTILGEGALFHRWGMEWDVPSGTSDVFKNFLVDWSVRPSYDL
jgi:hypothetical protein